MKTKPPSAFCLPHAWFALAAVAALLTSPPRAPGQTFVNLDFEAAIVDTNSQPGPAIWLDWSQAAPGWSHSAGESTGVVYYFAEHLGMSQYFLLMDAISPFYAPGTQLAGDYSLALASGREVDQDPASPWVNAFISQTGTLPGDAQALRMLATGPFRVFVDDVEISMTSLGGNAWEGNIAPFAGRLAELKIMNTAATPHTPTIVDNISFIPEPASAVLLTAGFAWLGLRKHPRPERRG